MRTLITTAVVSLLAGLTALTAPAGGSLGTGHGQARVTYCANKDAYEVQGCHVKPRLPVAAFTPQLHWMLQQVAGDAARVTAAEVRRHFTEAFLAQPLTSADEVVAALKQTLT
jgi:hypothetical protein